MCVARRRPEGGRSIGVAIVERIGDPARFEALREEWTALLAASSADGIFLTWEWLWTWWRHFGRGRRLALLTVRREGELIAVAPLALGMRRTHRLVPFRALEFLGTGSVGSDYLDIAARRGDEVEALNAVARHLGGQPFALELRQLGWPSRTASALGERLAQHGWSCAERRDDVCPYIDLAGHSWSSYLGSLDGHHRNSFKRRLKHLMTTFDMRLEHVSTEEGRSAALTTIIDLHQRRWRERGGSTAFDDPALVAFHEEFTRRAAERGWLRLLVMRLGGAPAAAVYGLRYGGTHYFYQTGFDPQFARLGVGQVVVGLSIQAAIEDGAREYDFLHGDERYKFDWAHQARALGRLQGYPHTVRGELHRASTVLERVARTTARRALSALRAPAAVGGAAGA